MTKNTMEKKTDYCMDTEFKHERAKEMGRNGMFM